jgi:hypothetical protein
MTQIPMNGAKPNLSGLVEHAVAAPPADDRVGVGVDAWRSGKEAAVALWQAKPPGIDRIDDASVAHALDRNGPRLAAADATMPALVGCVQREQAHRHYGRGQFASASVNTRPSTSPSVRPSSAPIVGAMSRLRT